MAIEDDKHPKRPFNEAAQEPEFEVEFEADFNDDLNDDLDQVQDQRGNTDPKHDPKNIRNPYLTPSGTSPLVGRGGGQGNDHSQGSGQTDSNEEISDEEWQEQLRNGDHTYEGEFNGLRVRTWMSNEPSKEGIHEGRIEEMVVTKGEYGEEERLAHFKDGRWEKDAENTQERQSIMEAVKDYDPQCLESKSINGEPDRDKGHSR